MAKRREPDEHLRHILPEFRQFAVPMESIKLDPANARVHDEPNILATIASLTEHGQHKCLICQAGSRVIRIGNGTYEAAARMGWTQIAAVFIDESDPRSVARAIADNRPSDLSHNDDRILGQLLTAIAAAPDVSIEATGYTAEDAERLIATFGEATPAPAAPSTGQRRPPPETEPPAEAPADPPDSIEGRKKVLTMWLPVERQPEFNAAISVLADRYKLAGASDVIFEALRRELAQGQPAK